MGTLGAVDFLVIVVGEGAFDVGCVDYVGCGVSVSWLVCEGRSLAYPNLLGSRGERGLGCVRWSLRKGEEERRTMSGW